MTSANADAIILSDDHIETPWLRKYARDHVCAVIGAYKGATMRYMFEHGARSIIGVEPQQWAYDLAVKNLLAQGPHAWELDGLALVPWGTDQNASVLLEKAGTDGARVVWPHRRIDKSDVVIAKAMNVCDWLDGGTFDHFDFMVVNVEGFEYQLLPWLAPRATVLLVQFHGPPIDVEHLGRISEHDSMRSIGKGWYLYE